jgi:hypothetical protein
MNIGDVNVPVSPLWQCVEDIANHCKGIADMSNELIYGDNVKTEREDPRPLPNPEETPYIKVRLENTSANANTVDQYSVQRHATAAIYIYAYQTGPNDQLSYANKIEDLVEWTLLAFSSPHIDEPAFPKGMDFKTIGWRNWDVPQAIMTGPVNPVDVDGNRIQLPTGMVVRCIRLNFWTAGEIRPVDGVGN